MSNFHNYFNSRKNPDTALWLNDPDQVRKAGRLDHLELAQAATALREMARNRSPPPALGFDARMSAIEGFQRGIEADFYNSLHRISEMRRHLWNERPRQAEGAGFVALGTSSGLIGAEPITTIPITSAPSLSGASSSGVPGISSPASGFASSGGFLGISSSSGVPGPISQVSGSSSSSGSRGGGAQHRYNPMGGDATGRRHEKKADKEYFVLVTCKADPKRGLRIIAAQYPTENEARQACASIKDQSYLGCPIMLTYGEDASGKLRHRALGSQEQPAGQIWITVKRSDFEPNGNVSQNLRLEIHSDSRAAAASHPF
ncbi:hypothetical protein BDZ88DRAFT_474397 [Geranomyces variabilis]|nr:hypothetical protein BDZ88DRAFT_474397 [Geranomyces variabilis]KAJ3143529.1 hypothetical protein HDU90_000292 [Geranomyces variabilis]